MCQKTCNKKIAENYTEYLQKTKEILNKVDFVCTTADIWSSSKRSYLGITAHWIEPETFERRSVTLACRRFKGIHSFLRIAELIVDIHSEFDLGLTKIVKTITDNGSNMVKAFKMYGKHSETGLTERDLAHIEIVHENVDDDGDDYDERLIVYCHTAMLPNVTVSSVKVKRSRTFTSLFCFAKHAKFV